MAHRDSQYNSLAVHGMDLYLAGFSEVGPAWQCYWAYTVVYTTAPQTQVLPMGNGIPWPCRHPTMYRGSWV